MKRSRFCLSVWLDCLTSVAACYVFLDVLLHSQPPVVSSHQFQCFVYSWMSPRVMNFQSFVLGSLHSLVHILSFSMLQVLLAIASQVPFFLCSFLLPLPIAIFFFFFIFSNKSSKAWSSSCNHTNKWSPKRIMP